MSKLSALRSGSASTGGLWQPVNRANLRSLPIQPRKQLLDQGSLTQRLIKASQGNFKVELVFQGWQRPSFSERRRLRMPDRERGLIREVRLLCHGEAWVVARSVIPRSALKGKNQILAHLGQRPLGAVLFKNAKLQRTLFEVCSLQAENLNDFPWSPEDFNKSFWGRRSTFRIHGAELLVAEIFLPSCPVV